ncbi:MAG TPA: DNA-processing protein DprA [Polyangiaceae bacterium]|jgi:DNA processing protein|nr:DNA-processing protein DprA [Polyangiaceae bacterium]
MRALSGAGLPVRLRELAQPPSVVYVHGEIPTDGAAATVAIVGTRRPTAEGATFAYELARDLAEQGVVIVSGGAVGIDTQAHRGALAAGGRTVVVAPSSFDHPYPEENADLFRLIVETNGAFLTTFPPGTIALRHHFFSRNATLAALADALVVVETPFRGGARNAAKAARDLGRPVLVVPGAPWNPRAVGCIQELQWGAQAVGSARDVLLRLPGRNFLEKNLGDLDGVAAPVRPPGRKFSPTLPKPPSYPPNSDEGRVVSALQTGPAYPDELARRAGLGAPRIQALLLTLTLEGVLVSEPSGRIILVT